jgi:hypothetical protein
MTNLGTARTGLDSFVYWATFVVLVLFVTFFLNSMVELANAEGYQYDTSTKLDAAKMHAKIRAHRSVSTNIDDVSASNSSEDDLSIPQ